MTKDEWKTKCHEEAMTRFRVTDEDLTPVIQASRFGFERGVEYANRWTYLPELPKDYDFYLVTHKDENDNVMVSESLFASERWDVDNVIAWRELPEPADIR